MKWIDTTMFNGEPIIKLRLEYLFNAVDTFYICEQRFTHQGAKKDELFIEKYKSWFEPYLTKIRFLIDEKNYNGVNSWVIENAQRNYSVPYILDEHKGEEYIVSVCDSDEIPNIDAVKQNTELHKKTSNGAVIMEQPLYYYNLNWFVSTWKRAFFLNNLSLNEFKSLQHFRDYKGPIIDVFPCGWHMSYFMSTNEIRRKIESFAHTEVNKDEYKDLNNIRESIAQGRDVFKRYNVNISRNTNFDFPDVVLRFHEEIMKLQQE